jgi:hypothetical protein
VPEPTPADELRTAAASLRVAAEPAPPCQHPGCGCCEGWHKQDSDGLTVCTGCDYDAHRYVSPGYPMPDGMGPLLADWLEQDAVQHLPVSECRYCDPTTNPGKVPCPGLALARHINAKETIR